MSEEQIDLLREIASGTRLVAQLLALSVASEVPKRIAKVLDSEEKKKAYRASNGKRSAREVARLASTTHQTVGRWWEEWQKQGLAVDAGDGRMRAVFDMELLGLAGPLAKETS